MASALNTLNQVKEVFVKLKEELGKIIVGQEHIIEHVLISILTNQNALLESYPGLGKTLLIKSISEILDLDFKRIQNTPDLMPSDVIGTYIKKKLNNIKK